jgi:hypothetical protein
MKCAPSREGLVVTPSGKIALPPRSRRGAEASATLSWPRYRRAHIPGRRGATTGGPAAFPSLVAGGDGEGCGDGPPGDRTPG